MLPKLVSLLLGTCLLGVLLGGSSVEAETTTSNPIDSLVATGIDAALDGKPELAIEAFEAVLASAPHRIEALSAPLAFQYAWSGQLGRAQSEFRRATALDPENINTRLGELLVTNWMGDHLKAWRGYSRLRRIDISNPAPLMGLAAAQNWAGRRDLSLATLEVADNLAPGHRDIMHLRGLIEAGLRPQGGFFHDFAEDSDGFLVNGIKGELNFSPHSQIRLRPFWNKQKIRLDDRLKLKEEWLGLGFEIQPKTRIGIWGNWQYLLTPADEVDSTPYAGITQVNATLTDRIKVSGSFERFATVSYVTVPDKITGEVYGLHTEIRPTWRTKLN
ncbi:MAG: hypothetical protein HKN21_13480, partial [Candidatus Eisenbacteria bacterium]|nr:hypothetical protein [Candidatus Eisenbacteria bacterium]